MPGVEARVRVAAEAAVPRTKPARRGAIRWTGASCWGKRQAL